MNQEEMQQQIQDMIKKINDTNALEYLLIITQELTNDLATNYELN